MCTGLPNIAGLKTTASFPVNYGDTVTVTCATGYELAGDDVITCTKDTVFSYDNVPSCTPGENDRSVILYLNFIRVTQSVITIH